MPFKRRDIIRAFNRAVPRYDTANLLWRITADHWCERLAQLAMTPEKILECGVGTGYLTTRLSEQYPSAKVMGVDIAVKMLLQAKKQSNASIQWVGADAHHLPFQPQSFDLVLANGMLAWSSQPEQFFAEIRRVCVPGALFAFTTLGPDTLKELKKCWAHVDQAVHVHPFLDMHDVGDALVKAGFQEPVMNIDMVKFEYDSVIELMEELHATGSQNILNQRAAGLTGKQRFKTMAAAYEQYRDANSGMLPAHFEVIYGQAWAPEPADVRENGETLIPISRLRRRSF